MGIIDRLQYPSARADVTWTPLDERWYQENPGFSASTFAGFSVGPDTAKRVSAVFACVSLIAETLASLPCILYRRLDDDGAKERARDHRLFNTLRNRPNSWNMTTMDFFGYGQMHAGLRGNAYSEIKDDGRTIQLEPLHPALVTPEHIDGGKMRYLVRDPKTGKERTLLQDQVVHVRDLSEDGFSGQARATLAREAIATAAAGEAFVAGFFKNDATGRLVITHPGKLAPETQAQFREELRSNYAGWSNRSKTMLLTNGVDVTELGKQGSDSGFIVDPRKFQTSDIARFWRVPGFMIGLEEKTSSWGTGVAEMKQAFAAFTMKPWTDRWAQALQLALLTDKEQEKYFIEFLYADLLRGDLKSQMESYKTGREIGVWSANDVRKKLNENPREDPAGDDYQDTPVGGAPNAQEGQSASPPPPVEEGVSNTTAIPSVLVSDAVARIAGAETRDIGRRAARAKEDLPKWNAWVKQYYAAHRDYTVKVLLPLSEAFAVEGWRTEAMVDRIGGSGVASLDAGVPDGWADRRRDEIAAIIDECLIAGAMRAAA